MTGNELAERLENLIIERRDGISRAHAERNYGSIYIDGLIDGLDSALLLLREALG